MLEIRKKGNKNFTHIATGYANEYGANDITAIFDGNTTKLRSVSGRVIFNKEGYDLANVTIYDDSTSGSSENYATIEQLKQRLINLGYPFVGGATQVVSGIDSIVEGDHILVDATDPQNPVVSFDNEIDGGTA